MALGTEFACNFCTGMGPLQLGIVLVHFNSNVSILFFPTGWFEYAY